MPATSVSEMIARAKAAADMEDSGFVTAAQWLRWLNLEHRMFSAWLARQGYANEIATVSHTADGTGAFATALEDPIAIIGVWELVGTRYRALRSGDALQYQANGTTTGAASHYYLSDRADGSYNVVLFPRPTSGTYVAMYLPHPAALVTGTPGAGEDDEVRYPLGLEERVVLGMARRALAKEESSTAEVTRQIRELDAHAEAVAWDRLSGAVQAVRNVDHRERGWSTGLVMPPPREWLWR